jgi:hypothetical protein
MYRWGGRAITTVRAITTSQPPQACIVSLDTGLLPVSVLFTHPNKMPEQSRLGPAVCWSWRAAALRARDQLAAEVIESTKLGEQQEEIAALARDLVPAPPALFEDIASATERAEYLRDLSIEEKPAA